MTTDEKLAVNNSIKKLDCVFIRDLKEHLHDCIDPLEPLLLPITA